VKRSPWFPVWAGFQDDEQFLSVSAEAELLYWRAVARCKLDGQGDAEGVVSRHQLRRLTDKMSTDPLELCRQLCEADPVPLWVELPDGRFQIRAYGAWVRSAEQYRQAKAANAKLGNHTRWGHEGPVATCHRCNPDQLSPNQSHRTRNGIPKDSLNVLDVDEYKTPPTPPSPGLLSGTAEGELVLLADQTIQAATQDPTALADPAQRQAVAEALAAGHPPSALLAAGQEASSGHRPLGLLRAILKRLANEPPERRPLLDDQRTPCGTCHATTWIDNDDGTVTRCTDCTTPANPTSTPAGTLPPPHSGGIDATARAAARTELTAGLKRAREDTQ
jgi:hypothetical protein